MKIILLKDVSKVGQRYEVKEVASGYALNFLIPQGLAKTATDSEISKIEKIREEENKKLSEKSARFKKTLDSLKDPIVIEAKANEQGHLFKGLNEKDLSAQVKNQKGIEIDSGSIELPKPIKEIGEYEVKVRSFNVEGRVTFKVVASK